MKNEFKVIADLIEKDKKVLDVGCADGTLMKFLKDNKNINIRGLEISKDGVQKCIAKGLTVIEGNAEKDLRQFPDKSFDYVVLSQTLQAFLNPELVINELLRVGKKAIVTIPNFGYWKIRIHLLIKGTMPITNTLPDESILALSEPFAVKRIRLPESKNKSAPALVFLKKASPPAPSYKLVVLPK